jgi:hypothetical protein
VTPVQRPVTTAHGLVFILTLQPVLAKTQTCQQKSQTVQNVVMNLPTARKDRLDALAMTILLACCVFWGFQQVMVKATLPEVPSVLQAGIRFSGATLVLLVWARWRGIRFGGGLPLATHLVPGLAAGLLFFGEFAFLQLAIRDIPASRLTVLLYTSPFWVAVCLPVFVKSERLGRWQWLGLGLAFGAVAFALRESLQLATSHWGVTCWHSPQVPAGASPQWSSGARHWATQARPHSCCTRWP